MTDAKNGKVPSEETLPNAARGNVGNTEEVESSVRLVEEQAPASDGIRESADEAAAEAEVEEEAAGADRASAEQEDIEAAEGTRPEAGSEEKAEAETKAQTEPEPEPEPEPEISEAPAGEAAEEAYPAASAEETPAAEEACPAASAEETPAAAETAEPAAEPQASKAAPNEEKAEEPKRQSVPPAGTHRPGSVPPDEPPKKAHTGLLIALILVFTAAIVASCILYIRFFVPKEIHVSAPSLDLRVGDTAKLEYIILPASADNLEVGWASSNPEVASIDEFGVVTALSGGECSIAVATGNGKTDICIVTVTDPARIQKESLSTVRSFVDSREGVKEGSMTVSPVEDIDEKHSYLMGSDDKGLYLIYRTKDAMNEMGVEAQYSTYVKLSPENIDTAEVKQEDILYVYGFPISMVGEGSINLGSYQHGDKVPLTQISSNVTGLDATEALHEHADKGSTICLEKFAELLAEEDFGFTPTEFGFTNYVSLEPPQELKQAEEPEAAKSEAQASWDTISGKDLFQEADEAASAAAAASAEEALRKQYFTSKPEGAESAAGTEAGNAESAESSGSETEKSGKVFDIPSVGPGFSFDLAKE